MKKYSTLILVLFAFSFIGFSQISEVEKNTLIDLFEATNGEQWNSTWDLNEEASNWHGVTVTNNTVTAIDLTMNNII